MATFGTFTTGQVLTAAELNTAGVWQSYTPTWTQDVAITKTVNWARYTELNKLVTVNIKMTASSAGTANNIVKIGLPVAASANNYLMGIGHFVDESVNPDRPSSLYSIFDSSTTVSFIFTNPGDVNEALRFGQTGAGRDVTLASGDIMYMNLTYEAA
jgi:hypothetical protein